jgi:hypothetical protein
MMSSLKQLLVPLIALSVLGGLYYMLWTTGFFDKGVQTAEQVRSLTSKMETEVLNDFFKIDRFALDDSVLRDPSFLVLVDTPLVIDQQASARTNPFAAY